MLRNIEINVRILFDYLNSLVTAFLTVTSLFRFLQIKGLTPYDLFISNNQDKEIVSIVALIIFNLLTVLVFFLCNLYLDRKSILFFYVSSLIQIPFILNPNQSTVRFETLCLHAIFLSIPFSIIAYNIFKINTIYIKIPSRNIRYYLFSTFTFIYSLFVLVRHYSFKSNGQDLGVYIQTIHELGQQPPIQLTNWYGLIHPFAIHFEPILYLFVPFDYLKILPPVLLITQVLGVTLGILGIYKISDYLKLPNIVPLLASLIYSLSPGMQHGLMFDFHTTMLMPSFIIYLFYFIMKNKTIDTILLTLLFLLIKEDTSAYVLFFGIYSIWSMKNLRLGLSLVFMGSIYGFLSVGKIIPTFGKGNITNFVFDKLGESLSQATKTLLLKPLHSFIIFFTPFNQKLAILISSLLHSGVLSTIGYKELILLIPMFGMRFFTEFDRMWGFSMYYAAPSIAVIVVAGLKGYSKLNNRLKFKDYALISLIYGTVFTVLIGVMPQIPGYYSKSIYRSLLQPNYIKSLFSENSQSIRKAISFIPENDSVCTSQSISPHLSMREKSAFLGSSVCDNSYENILINIDINNWPLSEEDVYEKVNSLISSEIYKVQFSSEGTVLFSKECCDGNNVSDYIIKKIY